jgi:Peptidase family M50.
MKGFGEPKRIKSYYSGGIYMRRRRSLTETKHILISWFVLSFLFSYRYLILGGVRSFYLFFLISLFTVGLGFVLHELAHKYVARFYGHWAEFRMSIQGLLLAVLFTIISFGLFIFAAPGATVIIPTGGIFGYGISKKENGIISAAGPITNLILAFVFFVAFLAGNLYGLYFLALLGYYGLFINVWLAAFNLIPLGILDGAKVFSWSIPVWFTLAIPSWAISILFLAGIF